MGSGLFRALFDMTEEDKDDQDYPFVGPANILGHLEHGSAALDYSASSCIG